jgi:signal transduction histidine kinase
VTRRLVLGYLGLALFVLVALEVPLGVQHQRTERRDFAAKVEHDATTLASVAEDAVQNRSSSQLRHVAAFAYDYTRSTGTRVVIVDRRGVALVDTAPRGQAAESFASRPEIAAALRGTVASGTRRSETLRTTLLYVAVPVASGGVVHGALRITIPTSAVDARILSYWLILAAVAAVVLAAAALVAVALARFVTRPLRGLERAAAAFGTGDFDARAPDRDGPPEVRSLARVFNENAAKLGQLVRAQGEFVADASHQLRTPLTALRLRLETGDVEGGLTEVERLAALVDELLALARADARPAVIVDVAAVVHERVEHWRSLAEEREVVLEADTNGEARAHGARERIAQTLDNLLSNAFEVAPPGTTVTVSVRIDGPWVDLRVRDRGPGMTDEQRTRAFDRFWSGGERGSGLGLAIARRLLDADGGTIELRNADGGGLEAHVRLRSA